MIFEIILINVNVRKAKRNLPANHVLITTLDLDRVIISSMY